MRSLDLPKRIAFIVAHPDDETEISAGTIYQNFKKGGQNFLFCATLGEKGNAYLNTEIDAVSLGELRKEELYKVGQFLGIEEIIVSDFPDGSLENYLPRLRVEVGNFLDKVQPEIVISFGLDGYSGHKDHVALSQIVKKNVTERGLEFIEFSGPSEEVCAGYEECLFKKRKNGAYQDLVRSKANICVEIDREVKLSAINMYETQRAGLDPFKIFPKQVADHLVQYEYFYKAEEE